jgi:hypothetical protein
MENQINEWRRLVDRIHDQINGRANMFLIINAFLFAAATNSSTKCLPTFLSIVGLIVCIMWFILGNYSKNRYDALWQKLLDEEKQLEEAKRIYTFLREKLPRPSFPKMSSTEFLSYVLPRTIGILWIITLLFFCWSS